MSDAFEEMVIDTLVGDRSADRLPTTRLVKSDLIRTSKNHKKPKYYYEKIKKMGNVFEHVKYEYPVFYNFDQKTRKSNSTETKTEEEKIKNRGINAYRSKKKVRVFPRIATKTVVYSWIDHEKQIL